ncbi:DUF418 domain-containing protein [Kocuria atrinae]|uniref:DUF418 domain-containing protein n=1 Tax=Kocuria atrinae TaxID=592377 RepID=UPI0003072DD3|nr:DUF418 domain-containing protein [Kocuria atrinae]
MLALIALANVMIYLHDRPYGLRQHIVEDAPIDKAVAALMVIFVDGRAYPLFAALFGYGLVRIADHARHKGADDRGVTSILRSRSRLLIAFGLLHAVLAFSGDILGWYGLIGLVVASWTRLNNRALLWIAAVGLVIGSAVQGFVYADTQVSDQRSILWSFAISSPVEALGWRTIEWVMTPVGLLSVASAALVGMWIAHSDFLERPANHLLFLKRVAIIGIAMGILGGVGMALATIGVWDTSPLLTGLLSWLHIFTGVPAGFGYLAAIALLSVRLKTGYVVFALRATGERSLSAYLAQTVPFALLLPAHTLGVGAWLTTSDAAILGLVTWLATVVGASILALHGYSGPAEYLMRRLRLRPRKMTERKLAA